MTEQSREDREGFRCDPPKHAETWLAFPVDDKGYNPESSSFVPLRFPVALKRHKSRKHLVAMALTKKPTLERRGPLPKVGGL
jgi:hypothetical protein